MTDAKIIKALECCTKGNTSDVCSDCPLLLTDICTEEENGVMKLALDLINRQQAEIERLHSYDAYKYAKSEAYKEFAERVAPIIEELVDIAFSYHRSSCVIEMCKKSSEIACGSDVCINENKTYWKTRLDNLLKEMGCKTDA